MTKTIVYTYLGTNGIITSKVHLENIYSVKNYFLEADKGYALTKDNGETLVHSVTVTSEDDIANWKEVKLPEVQGQK